jgi:DNA (cytosine-5)-methyltransferase 1
MWLLITRKADAGGAVVLLGSHFDGISAFPYAASFYGIKAIWATETEPFPVAVSKHHFPHVRHYGDISRVNGAELEPVDIITFGSPCQDMSVAGKREGLYGERSGLFMEAGTIREMREATNGAYPRYAIWENVPGAFSSNKGHDFRAVLEEITEAEIPMPQSGKWATAGMVRGNGRSVAWRVLDAQYWGVPQRRRRIFLVADFRGQCAPKILFECESVSGNSQESGEAREAVAGSIGDGVETAGRVIAFNGRQDPVYGEVIGALDTDRATQCVAVHPQITGTLCASGAGMNRPAGMASETDLLLAQCITTGTGRRYDPETETLIPVAFGPGGQHDIAHALRSQPSKADKPSSTTYVIQSATMGGNKKQNGLGVTDDPCYTLDCRADHAVAHAVDCRNLYETEELSGTLQSKPTGGYSLNYQNPVRVGYRVRRLTPLECERLQGFPDGWTDIPGASDTARYKAIGNSIAVPCLDFIYSQLVKVAKA